MIALPPSEPQRPWWSQPSRRRRAAPTTPRDALGRWTIPEPPREPARTLAPAFFNEIIARTPLAQFMAVASSPGSGGGGGQHSGQAAAAAPSGSGREYWLFRGRDRNLLLQTLRDMTAIVERDKLAASGKTTTTLSTRTPIFPPAASGLPGAVMALIEALEYDASLVRDRGPGGGYYSVDDSE